VVVRNLRWVKAGHKAVVKVDEMIKREKGEEKTGVAITDVGCRERTKVT